MLFSVLLANLKEEMGRVKWEGIRLREGRVCILVYADDVMLIAKREDEMRSMIDRLEEEDI